MRNIFFPKMKKKVQGVSQKSIQTSELVVGLADKLTNSSSEVWILLRRRDEI